MENKGFFHFKIIINVLVSSFCIIWLRMLWVYGYYIFFQCGDHIKTSKDDPRTETVYKSKFNENGD